MTSMRLGLIAGLFGAVAWACGDGGAAGASHDGRSALVRLREEPSGGHCPEGGTALEAGLDQDGDGALGDAEVTATTYVCDGTQGTDGAKALVELADEPAGPHCAHGGTAVRTGVDQDGDGALDDSEVTDSRYLCNEPPGEGSALCPGGVVEGSYTLENSFDAALLAGCTRITGSLTVKAPGLTEFELPLLATVGGSVDVRESAALTRVALPLLATVGGSVDVGGSAVLTALELPLLATVGGGLDVGGCAGLTALELPLLATVGGRVDVGGCVALKTLELPLLATVGGGVDVGGSAALRTLELPLLATAACLRVHDNSALSLLTAPALHTLRYCDSGSSGYYNDSASLEIGFNAALTSLAMPLLATAGGDVGIFGNDALTSLAMPVLATAGGDVSIFGNAVLTSLAVPRLATAGGGVELFGNDTLTSFAVPLLTTVGGRVGIFGNVALTAFEMPLLARASCLRVEGNAALSLLTLPALQMLDGCSGGMGSEPEGLNISQDDVLTSFAMPLLASIGGPLAIRDNPELPECPIWGHFFGTLQPSGVSGSITIAGNKDDGPC